MPRLPRTLVLSLLALVAVTATHAQAAPAGALPVACTQNSKTIPPYEVFELSFRHDRVYANPFFDVTIEVRFLSPSGKEFRIGGFHYGSSQGVKIDVQKQQTPQGERKSANYLFDKQDLWKARFAPAETGAWKYAWTFSNSQGEQATGAGSFLCVKDRAAHHGFVRQDANNPFRWVFDDGTPYWPIGIQECLGDGPAVGSWLSAMSMEGPFRTDRKDAPALPPGPLYMRGPAMNPVNADLYFRAYGRAGFNLFRFSQKNCTPDLYRDLDHYLPQQAIMTDELLRCARKHGFRIFYGLFGYQPVFNDKPENAEGMEKLKRFVQYSVNRWGAYVDFWEFLNEQNAADGWYAVMAPYLHSIDPYRHPVTTSWERPKLDGIEVSAPHWYGNESERDSDSATAAHATEWKKAGKPVVVGEQGNAIDRKTAPPEIGGVWDAGSALRMRLRNWSALFNEISFIFWNTSYARDGHTMNIWLGPQERQYVRAMQDFAGCLDKDVRMVPVTVSDRQSARAYALASPARAAVYLHHYRDHQTPTDEIQVTLDVPKATKGYWYSPENGAILARFDAKAGRQTLAAPPFLVDIALLITAGAAPDSDHDGKANDLDSDDDNDGVPDVRDAFPLDPEEWADTDHDLIGDRLDADADGDGVPDDRNKNGIPDYEEMDFDGDKVDRANAVPWDAFPWNPKEWRDTDGDGIGDNSDPDIDGDGYTNVEERRAKTDPLDPLSYPVAGKR